MTYADGFLQAGTPAGTSVSPALLQWGAAGSAYAGDAAAPGFLQDIFARVGGPDGASGSAVGATTMIEINNGHVIGDNFWLWRADHSAAGKVSYDFNKVDRREPRLPLHFIRIRLTKKLLTRSP